MNTVIAVRRSKFSIGLLLLVTYRVLILQPEAQGAPADASALTSRFGAQQMVVDAPPDMQSGSNSEWQSRQEKVFHELRAIGIGWGRYLARCDVMRPTIDKPEGYNFTESDFATGAASRAGIALVGQLTNNKSRGFYPGFEPLTDRDSFVEYVRLTAERYDGDSDFGLREGDPAYPDCDLDRSGKITEQEKAEWAKSHRIQCWELVKEPVPLGRPMRELPGMSGEDVAKVLEAGYTAIKKADPDALVLFGGLAPGGVGGIEALRKYLNEILDAGAGQYFDIMGVDAFSDPVEQMMQIHHEVLESHAINKRIWVVQTGTNAVGQNRFRIEGGSLAKQASFVVKGIVRAFASGAEKVFYGGFMYRMDEDDVRDMWRNYGLLHIDTVQKRPGFYTYALLITKIEGFNSVQKLGEGQYLFQFSGKPPVFVLWKEDEKETIDLSAQLKTDQVVLTHIIDEKDMTTPHIERVPASAISLTEKPVFVEAAGKT